MVLACAPMTQGGCGAAALLTAGLPAPACMLHTDAAPRWPGLMHQCGSLPLLRHRPMQAASTEGQYPQSVNSSTHCSWPSSAPGPPSSQQPMGQAGSALAILLTPLLLSATRTYARTLHPRHLPPPHLPQPHMNTATPTPRPSSAASATSTATRASCATAATPLRSWQSAPASQRWPT
jgi:hypothetical protein